jgi:hypothetical protein
MYHGGNVLSGALASHAPLSAAPCTAFSRSSRTRLGTVTAPSEIVRAICTAAATMGSASYLHQPCGISDWILHPTE